MKTTFDKIMISLIAVILAILVLILSSCVESITVSGRYADYKITPKRAVVIETQK